MFFIDPMYLILVMLPGMAIAGWASARVRSAYRRASQIPSSRHLTGADAAERLLAAEGIRDVRIEPTSGTLSDHFDPRSRVLRLSRDVYQGHSLASLGIAAHEAGHAIQQAQHYGPLAIRNAIVPTANIGSSAGFVIVIIGLIFQSFAIAMVGVALFAAVLLFQIVNLPVEFDASARARQALLANGIVSESEEREVAKVLNAAAMTYVAATITAALTMLYFLMRALGTRD